MKLSQKSIDYLLSVNICAKPHFARCFVEDGYCDNIPDAMRDICCKLPFVPSLIDANESISTILKSNGIPIWAHPLGGINEPRFSKETFLYILDNLVKMGLKGIECYYSLYTKEEIDFLVSTAKKYNLFISVGSDYHGKNVKKVKIGEVSSSDIDINYEDILPLINYIKSRH